jgi:hypothetical protein
MPGHCGACVSKVVLPFHVVGQICKQGWIFRTQLETDQFSFGCDEILSASGSTGSAPGITHRKDSI